MGVPEGSVAMQVRIHGFKRADQRGVFANIELQESSDTAHSLLSLKNLYIVKKYILGTFSSEESLSNALWK